MSYFLEAWLLPPGISFLIMALGIICYLRYKTCGKIFLTVGISSLYLLSTPFFAYSLVDLLQTQYPPVAMNSLGDISNKSAIVVLGGGDITEPEYENKPALSETSVRRVRYAAYLAQKTGFPIIVSGGQTNLSTPSNAEQMAHLLDTQYNIKVLLKEERGTNTQSEAQLIIPFLQHHQFQSIFLVTNAWHMPRSVAVFQHQGIRVVPAPMGYFNYGPGYALISFLPNADALAASAIAFHEGLGLLQLSMNKYRTI